MPGTSDRPTREHSAVSLRSACPLLIVFYYIPIRIPILFHTGAILQFCHRRVFLLWLGASQ